MKSGQIFLHLPGYHEPFNVRLPAPDTTPKKEPGLVSIYRWQGTQPPSCWCDGITGEPVESLGRQPSDEAVRTYYQDRHGMDVEVKSA